MIGSPPKSTSCMTRTPSLEINDMNNCGVIAVTFTCAAKHHSSQLQSNWQIVLGLELRSRGPQLKRGEILSFRSPDDFVVARLSCLPAGAPAQKSREPSSGRSKRSGAALPNANITLTNVETNAQVAVRPDESGDFIAPSLAPGGYTIKTEASGFKQNVTEAVRLLANRTVRLDIALEPGEISQRVEVQATAPVINSESATIGNILESRVITSLPLNGRTLDRLIRISAGVTTDSASNPRVAGSAYWGGIHFNVDGVTYNDSGNGGAAYSFRNGASTLPSIDAVSEFKIDSNNQKAEFEGSASVTIVTKSGANTFHGSVFEFNLTRLSPAKNFSPRRA